MGKLVELEEAIREAGKLRAAGKIVVATNGCFDILHVGHARNLAAARAFGDVLFVGVNADVSVRKNKGSERPILPELARAELLAALAAVDFVFIFTEETPFEWIRKLRPHVHVKGGGADIVAHPDFAEQERVVAAAGGKLVLVEHQDGWSTSSIIDTIRGER